MSGCHIFYQLRVKPHPGRAKPGTRCLLLSLLVSALPATSCSALADVSSLSQGLSHLQPKFSCASPCPLPSLPHGISPPCCMQSLHNVSLRGRGSSLSHHHALPSPTSAYMCWLQARCIRGVQWTLLKQCISCKTSTRERVGCFCNSLKVLDTWY